MVWYCPVCWAEWGEGTARCLMCGARLHEDQGFAERLIATLGTHETSVVRQAARILGERGDRQAVKALVHALESTGDEFVLESIATALGRIGDMGAVAPLCRLVTSAPRAAREAACAALARLNAGEALPVLQQAAPHLGPSGLRAMEYLEGRAANPPPYPSDRWKRRAALEGDATALVREKLGLAGCPICALMSEDLDAFLAQWQYLAPLHKAVRERFCERRGFCAQHLAAMRRVASPQGLDIPLSDMLAILAEDIPKLKEAPWALTGSSSECALMGDEDGCQACALCAQAEARYVDGLAGLLQEPPFRPAYAHSRGVCLPHFLCVRQRVPDNGLRQWLDEVQRSCLKRLVAEMQSHLRKHSQRLRREMTGEEERASLRSLAMLRGDPAVVPGISTRLTSQQPDAGS
jgi:hypothetical protein